MSSVLYGWYYGPEYNSLSQDEKEANAAKAMSHLRQNGFTIWAAAGIVGNMWAESGMNPGLWQGGIQHAFEPHIGYGLVQWTYWEDFWPWPAGSTDWENNGPRQCERIEYERDTNDQFYTPSGYPHLTWTDYETIRPASTETDNDAVNRAAEIFMYYYIRPGNPAGTLVNRQYHARYVFANCPGNALAPWLLMWSSKKNRRVM